MAVEISPTEITGRWRKGYALHLHTLSSIPTGPDASGRMQFDTTRTDIGEHLHQLKNRGNVDAADPIIKAAAQFLKPKLPFFDIIVPVPPSKARHLQPVPVLAEGIAKAIGKPYCHCVTPTRATAQLKNITDPEARKTHMVGLYAVDSDQTKDKRILLFDDLFRSGTTLNAITDLLLTAGNAKDVLVLTITKTRVNQ